MTPGVVTAGRTGRAVRLHDRATRATTNHDGATPTLSPTTMAGDAGKPQSSSGSCSIVTLVTPSMPAAASTTTLLAVVFSDFYRQHSFRFQALGTIIHQFSLTLMSSTSFGDYLISGTQHTNLSQNGRNPKPAGLPLHKSTVQLLGDSPEHDIKERPSARHKQSIKTERRVPSPFGSTISDKPHNQDPN